MAGFYTFKIDQGAATSRALTWQDQNGVPIDLTGFNAKMQIRASKGITDPVLLTLDNGINGGIVLGTEGNFTTGLITITITPAQTTALGQAIERGYYDLVLTRAQDVKRLVEGPILLDLETTVL